MKKILIVHFRVGKTDGVSLEIKKRKEVLKKMGYKVELLSGPRQRGTNYIIPELEFDSDRINKITRNSFYYLKDFSRSELKKEIETVAEIIERKARKIIDKGNFNILMFHNIFSYGGHIPATKAFYNIIFYNIVKEKKIPTIVTHHDFYWEKSIYKNPTCPYVKKCLKQYFVPNLPNVSHVVINSINRKKLLKKGIKAQLIPDIFNFSQPRWRPDNFNKGLIEIIKAKSGDIVILQATRIIERKGIELAIDLVATLNQEKFRKQLEGKTLYNGQQFLEKSKFILVFAGQAEKSTRYYLEKLKNYAKEKNVYLRNISSRIEAERKKIGEKKIYSLWDSYVFADFVTYPSLWEGWGNQFIEAVFARKPVVIYEYPVFKSDIASEGYNIISLGKKRQTVSEKKFVKTSKHQLKTAAQAVVDILKDKRVYKKMVRRNYWIGKKNHSFKKLRKLLRKILRPEMINKLLEINLNNLIPKI